ncbi:hypothetical protein P154DRAFT_449822 [Amniculicola lignicola CBS 123094]|uniref:FAD-binding FR-type domain-containing protein n=1 Tax=Amniculicola lignicola CBS 123094 TaxID=1392246 RepID=A0A6A5VXX6_9PLEO|nr:hypothetical protein P154DRAFT_449822 [Amniculicola lignicola CBS 123094]
MLYTFILWAVIGGILLFFILARLFRPNRKAEQKQGFLYRSWRSFAAGSRRYLLPESFPQLFPNTTRLQVLILAIICIYLTIFSLVGIVYKTWITPVKASPGKFNTRTGLGGFSDRVGALAYALTPLTIGLCSRDSILSLLTGIPYQNFNFLHRWTGRIILVQSFIHTIGWTIIEGKLYQPQPKVYNNFIKQPYMIWGIVAQGFITFLYVFSLRPVIRWTGYEFFRKTHLVVAGLYLGACWGHWNKLACWMIAALGLLGVDLGMRVLRVCLIHLGYKDGNKGLGFRAAQSKIELFKDPSGTIIRMEFTHNHEPWKIGQHFYITFPSLSVWQSHPFTPASTPPTSLVPPKHTYIIRARSGETGKLAQLVETAATAEDKTSIFTTPVVMLGPYGQSIIDTEASNFVAIAGGTGISFTLPAIIAALANPSPHTRNIEFVWIIPHIDNLAWIAPELTALKSHLAVLQHESGEMERDTKMQLKPIISSDKRFRIRIFVTRGAETRTHIPILLTNTSPTDKDMHISSPSSRSSTPVSHSHSAHIKDLLIAHPDFEVTYLDHQHPDIPSILGSFVDGTVESGRTRVIGSGPAALGTDLRKAVAGRNGGAGVWRGDERGDVELVWDDRLG